MLDNSLYIVKPSGELPIEDVCLKDVPAGIAYKIVDSSIFPESREYRNAWEADMSNPDGYGIGQEAWFALQKEKEESNDNN